MSGASPGDAVNDTAGRHTPPLCELTKFVADEKERWGKVVVQAGLAGTQ